MGVNGLVGTVLRSKSNGQHRAIWVALHVLWLLLVTGWSGNAQNVQDPTWNSPVNLSNSPTLSDTPSLAVDPSGMVHVVWSERTTDDRSSLWYVHGQRDSWSAPIDVLLTPGGATATLPTLAADEQGNLHVAWLGGGRVYYSQAYAPAAGSAKGWSRPQYLLTAQNYLGAPDLEVAPWHDLFLAYTVQIDQDSGVYLLHSDDGGAHWSDRQAVYTNNLLARKVDRVRLAAGPDGLLHVVWVESAYPETYPPLGIWYAVSGDSGSSWSAPVLLAEGPYDYPEIMVRGENEVHVVWSGTATDRYKFHIWSADSGRTWSQPWRNEALGGIQGLAALVLDGSNGLHWIQVGSIFDTIAEEVHPDHLFEQEWLGSEWGQGRAILSNGLVGNSMLWVSSAAALRSELHVVVVVPLATSNGYQMDILLLHRTLAARSIPAQRLALPTETPLARPQGVRTTVPDVTPAAPVVSPTSLTVDTLGSAESGPWQPLTLGIAMATAVCALTVGAVMLRRTCR